MENQFTEDELSTIEFCLNLAVTNIDADDFELTTQREEVESVLEKVKKNMKCFNAELISIGVC